MSATLQALHPYFGGKSGCAAEIWSRFGDVPNYVEAFVGSAAVTLARPHEPKTETLNDLDGFVVNLLRALSADPEAVAHYADWPVSECDLTARHAYLVRRIPWLTERLMGDPFFCDVRLAGWWVWGACAWIGSGWCSGTGPWAESGGVLLKKEDVPHLGDAGRNGFSSQGLGILAWMESLQSRLRSARITCGDWRRVLTPVVTERHGITGVFLDPPYAGGEMEYSAGDGAGVAAEVAAWCRENGANPMLRICLAGHDGEHDLAGWSVHHWKARGGYGNSGGADADDNRHRETLWFSPACLGAQQATLFGGEA